MGGGHQNEPQESSYKLGNDSGVSMSSEPKKPSNRTFIGILVIIILIILIAYLPSDGQDEEVMENGEQEQGEVMEPNENNEQTEASTGGSTTTAPVQSSGAISFNGHAYSVGSVDWLFTQQGAQTAVRIQLVDFRRDNVLITVLPYRLGNYAGTCSAIAAPADGATVVSGARLLAAAECNTEATRRQFLVYQNGRFVETYVRTAAPASGALGSVNKIQSIDLAEIVQN